MPFEEGCIFLDKTQMSRPVKYNKTMDGFEPIVGAIHYVCQSDDNFGWISECPDNCKSLTGLL